MIAFRPENSSDIVKVIIKHKDVFDGSTVTPQVRTQWLQETGWSENDVKHYDNAGIEYSIAGRKNQLTNVFNLFGPDYVKIEGFVFEDYKYARSTINIMGKGNVVLNNQFKNIGCVYIAPWTWSNQGVYRPDVTIPVAGPMTFKVTPVAGDAQPDKDYSFIDDPNISFGAGDTSKTVRVKIIEGYDPDQLLVFRLEPVGSTPLEAVGARDMHLVRIDRAEKRVLVINNVGDSMGTSIVEYHAPGELVTIDAKSKAGYTFDGWQPGIDAMEVTPISADDTRATFIMPDYNQRIQAKWKLNGSRANVSGLRLDKKSLALNAGYTAKIQASVSPDNATDKVVLWTSSNPLVASVDSKGNVTGLSQGTAEIIARSLELSDKQFTARCKVSVTGTIAPSGNAIEAEDYNHQSGIDTENCSEGGIDVAYIESGDYIGFDGINFGRGAESLNFRVASNGSSGAIEVHLGSPDGKLIGTMDVTDTGGWQKWSTQICRIEKTTGVNDVYFVFKGGERAIYSTWKSSASVIPTRMTTLQETAILTAKYPWRIW